MARVQLVMITMLIMINLTTYGMSVYLGQDINILNCLFQESCTWDVLQQPVLKGSNSFKNNCRGCSDRNHTCFCLGEGIHTCNSTLNFEAEISTFADTSAFIFEAENSIFAENSAEDGGGIYTWQSTLNFTGNTTFRNNSADKGGGGIRAFHISLKFTGNTTY